MADHSNGITRAVAAVDRPIVRPLPPASVGRTNNLLTGRSFGVDDAWFNSFWYGDESG